MITERTYKQYKDIINPNNLIKGRSEYHIDHIIPLWPGYLNYITPDLLTLPQNLMMIFHKENKSRSKTTITEEEKFLPQQLMGQI